MLDNCSYDKIKLIEKLSCIAWFIEKHTKANANNDGDQECLKLLENLQRDAERYAEVLKVKLLKEC